MPACSVGLLFFFPPYNHAEYDLFCQLLVLLADTDALWCFPLAAEEMLLVETSFSNRVVALLSFKEMWEWVRLCAGGCRDFQYLDNSVPAAFAVCVFLETLACCLWWKVGIYLRAWRLMTKGKGWCGCRRTGKVRAMLAEFNLQREIWCCLYPALIRNGWRSRNWGWGGDWITFWVDEFWLMELCICMCWEGPSLCARGALLSLELDWRDLFWM